MGKRGNMGKNGEQGLTRGNKGKKEQQAATRVIRGNQGNKG